MSADLVARRLEGWVDPAVLFAGGPAHAAHCFWLDAGPGATGGWSLLGVGDPAAPPLTDLDASAPHPPSELPGPFRGGWIGWLGYDAAAAAGGAPAASTDPAEQSLWLRVDRFVAVDHAGSAVWAVAPADAIDDHLAEVTGWARARPLAPSEPEPVLARARNTPAEYARLIEQCRDAIRAGEAYQLCLTTRFDVPASAAGRQDPVEVYLRLRQALPAHHGGFIRSGDRALASASPEVFLHLREGIVRTRPIKGTRPRSADPVADAAWRSELQGSEKERAENVMIVDLMRNDLQRVCLPGTVAAERLLEIESYPAVHQLVSTVAGRLAPATTVADVLAAAFPAGSMTGAPKLSAMTILHGLEQGPRGVYSGCFGWVGSDGAADLAMVIRSIVFTPDAVSVGAGGGITWLSVAAEEVAEVGVKARGVLAAVGATLPPGW